MLVMVLLTLIILALMSVFNATQTAFRSSVTQTDVLEGGRATMDLVANDFRQMAPCGGYNVYLSGTFTPQYPPSFALNNLPNEPVNFWLSGAFNTVIQTLIGSPGNALRTNSVQSVFILSFQNQVWKGVGYFVDTNSTSYIYPLYRYDSSVLPGRPTPLQIFTNFLSVFNPAYQTISDANTNIHHLLDGVVHFNVRAFDTNGVVLTNGYGYNQSYLVKNATFYYPQVPPPGAQVSMFMCSNTLPASVEIQMAVMEDRTLSRASSFGLASPLNYSNYLAQQVGKTHLFRQLVTIPNFDPIPYQP